MERILKTWLLLAMTLTMLACGNDAQQAADEMLRQAEQRFERKDYQGALAAIDSLRRIYPSAIEARKKAITLKQNIALKQAQEDLALTDSALQAVNSDYEYQRSKVEKDKAELRVTKEELDMLARTKMKRDSLQVRFDVQCAKIKYIHRKQKEGW